jgi:hypothetical protein
MVFFGPWLIRNFLEKYNFGVESDENRQENVYIYA